MAAVQAAVSQLGRALRLRRRAAGRGIRLLGTRAMGLGPGRGHHSQDDRDCSGPHSRTCRSMPCEPGDLLFYYNLDGDSQVDHVVMYAGSGPLRDGHGDPGAVHRIDGVLLPHLHRRPHRGGPPVARPSAGGRQPGPPARVIGTMARWPAGARFSARRTDRRPLCRSVSLPTTLTGPKIPACPTSTNGAVPNGRGPLARATLRAHLLEVVPGRVGRLGKDPGRWRRTPGRQPRRSHPFRRARHHARDREGAWAAGLRPRRLLLPDGAGRGNPVGACGRRLRPPANAYRLLGSSISSRWSSPRAPRGRRSRSPTATSSGASGAAASSRSPCVPGCRSSRSPWWAPKRRCRSCCGCRAWPGLSGLPYFPITANVLALGPLGSCTPFPAKFKLRVLPTRILRRAARPGAVLEEPDHGGVRAHPLDAPRVRLRHAARSPQRVVRLSRPWAAASSSREPTPFGVVAWSKRSRPTRAWTSSWAWGRGRRRSHSNEPSSCGPTRPTPS